MIKKLHSPLYSLGLIALLGTFTAFAAPDGMADDGISIANGKVKFDAIAQVWFVNDTSLGTQTNSTNTVNGTKFDMYVRRAVFQFTGAMSESTHWNLVADPANQSTTGNGNILQEVEIEQELFKGWSLTVGQMKQITVAESLDSDAEILFPERSMVARTWGENWGQGAILTYKTHLWKLAGMISNDRNTVGNNTSLTGSSLMALDGSNHNPNHPNNKDVTVRLDVRPSEMVGAGAFSYFPGMSWGYGGAVGGNFQVMPVEDLVIRGEYVHGWAVGTSTNAAIPADRLPRDGYFVDAAYQYGDWQPAFRYEIQQQNTSGTTNAAGVVTGSAATFGLNYYLMKHNSKVQFAYTMLGKNTSGSDAATSVGSGSFSSATGQYYPMSGTGGGLATLAFQVAI